MNEGIRVRDPSNWSPLENLENVSGNSILVDFYNAGFNGTIGYSETECCSTNQSEFVNGIMKKYLDTSAGSFAIQPTRSTRESF